MSRTGHSHSTLHRDGRTPAEATDKRLILWTPLKSCSIVVLFANVCRGVFRPRRKKNFRNDSMGSLSGQSSSVPSCRYRGQRDAPSVGARGTWATVYCASAGGTGFLCGPCAGSRPVWRSGRTPVCLAGCDDRLRSCPSCRCGPGAGQCLSRGISKRCRLARDRLTPGLERRCDFAHRLSGGKSHPNTTPVIKRAHSSTGLTGVTASKYRNHIWKGVHVMPAKT